MSEIIVIEKSELYRIIRQATMDAAEMVVARLPKSSEEIVSTKMAMEHLQLTRPTFKLHAKEQGWKNYGSPAHPRWKLSELKYK